LEKEEREAERKSKEEEKNENADDVSKSDSESADDTSSKDDDDFIDDSKDTKKLIQKQQKQITELTDLVKKLLSEKESKKDKKKKEIESEKKNENQIVPTQTTTEHSLSIDSQKSKQDNNSDPPNFFMNQPNSPGISNMFQNLNVDSNKKSVSMEIDIVGHSNKSLPVGGKPSFSGVASHLKGDAKPEPPLLDRLLQKSEDEQAQRRIDKFLEETKDDENIEIEVIKDESSDEETLEKKSSEPISTKKSKKSKKSKKGKKYQ